MHLALKSSWLLQSAAGEGSAETNEHSIQLNQEIEMAIVNSKPVPPGSAIYSPSLEVSVPDLFERRKAVNKLQTTHNLVRRSAQGLSRTSTKKLSVRMASEVSGTVEEQSHSVRSSNVQTNHASTELTDPTKVSEIPVSSDVTCTTEQVVKVGSPKVSISKNSDEEFSENQEDKSSSLSPSVPDATPQTPVESPVPRPIPQKQRVTKGFVRKVGPITFPGSRVRLPSVYNKLGSPFHYSSFRGTSLEFSVYSTRKVC